MIETDYVQLTKYMPPVEDVVMQMVSSTGAKCYICDTFCRDFTPEKKAKADRRFIEIILRSERIKLMQRLKEEETARNSQ